MVVKRFNIKVNFFLFLSTMHLRCMVNGLKAAHTFLTSALGGSEWLVSCSNTLPARKGPLMGGWGWGGSDAVAREIAPSSTGN
jgi:hypothetical protein